MLQILHVRSLCARNLWHSHPVLQVEVAAIPVEIEELRPLLQLIQHLHEQSISTVSSHEPPPPTAAHALLRIAMLLQQKHDPTMVFGIIKPSLFPHVWNVVFAAEDATIGQATLDTAVRLIENLAEQPTLSDTEILNEYTQLIVRHRLGPRTKHLMQTARDRGIPVIRLDQESLLQLGQGIYRQRLRTTITDRTSLLAESISRDKHLCRQLLSSIGLPVVEGIIAANAEAAVQFAAHLGQPVVVKPRDADYGNGVVLNLTEPAQIRFAWRKAKFYSSDVIVERHQIGDWHRLMVIENRIVAAVRRVTPRIMGNGQNTVSELIELLNRDPLRGAGSEFPLAPLQVGPTELGVLYHQGLGLDSIPLAGVEVILREDAYLATGATQVDVTDHIHPDTAAIVIEATNMIGLDIAGVDLIAIDISQPPVGQSLAILEVNAEPAFTMHMSPFNVPSRPVPSSMLSSLFPDGQTGRIPLVAIYGGTGIESAIAEIMAHFEPMTAIVTRDSWQLGCHSVQRNSRSLNENLTAIWLHPGCAAGVVAITDRDIEREGIPFDRCEILVFDRMPAKNLAEALIIRLLLSTNPKVVVARPVDGERLSTLIPADCELMIVSEHGDTDNMISQLPANDANGVVRIGAQQDSLQDPIFHQFSHVPQQEKHFQAAVGRIVADKLWSVPSNGFRFNLDLGFGYRDAVLADASA